MWGHEGEGDLTGRETEKCGSLREGEKDARGKRTEEREDS